MGQIILFDELTAEASPARFQATPVHGAAVGDEKLIQRLAFQHPELIPIEEIDPGAGQVAPLCRELALQGAGGSVFLDMLGVTRRGRLVLVECKLWRNPQARREVIGQILEYAALMRKLSYGDLTALVQRRVRRVSSNLLWDLARERLGLEDEAAFVDAVSDSLAQGAFDLVVLGDGIRRELEAVRGYMEAASGLRSRLALVEVNAWRDDQGRTLFVPQVALRTRVIEHRAGLDAPPAAQVQRSPEADGYEPAPSPAQEATRASNRAFWQRFIDEVEFSHPDQPKPTHGGNNWVRLPLPVVPAVAYRALGSDRANPQLGFFLRFHGEAPSPVYGALVEMMPELEREIGVPLRHGWIAQRNCWDIAIDAPAEVLATDEAQLRWLLTAADKVVTAFRPRLAQLSEAGET